jgi:hypothetical protein
MRRLITFLVAILSFGMAGTSLARDIEDGKLLVYVTKDGKYKIGDFQGDKVGFYGVVGDWWERKHITGILLKKGEKATDEQKHIVYVTAKQLKITPYVEIDGKEQEIVEAAPAPVAAPAAAPAAEAAPAAATAPAPAAAADPNKH